MARRRLGRNERGAVAVEFALILPMMLVMCFGVVELTQLVRANMKVHAAAQTVAQLVAQQSDVNATSMANYCYAGQLVVVPMLTGPSLKVAVASVTNVAGTVNQDWQDTTCGGATAMGGTPGMAAGMVNNANDSVVIATATYTYTSAITYVLASSFQLSQTVYARPRGTSVPIVHN